MTTLRSAAYAKINLGLKIFGRRPDGFHALRTVFQTITLADTITLTLRPGRGVRLERVETAPGIVWTPLAAGHNLAVRAAESARQAFSFRGEIGVHIRKRIPLGAGLGGGSADAAAVLRLLAGRARRRPPLAELLRLGAELGSDVPALILGGTVLGLGRGEECYPLPSLPRWHCLLAAPMEPVATAAAYQRWDQIHQGPRALRGGVDLTPPGNFAIITTLGSLCWTHPAFRRGRDRGPEGRPKVRAGTENVFLENDFEEAVFPLSPDFSAIRRALGRSGAVRVGLSGSGAAQYGLYPSRAAADAARAVLPAGTRSWTVRFARPAADPGRNWGVVQR